MAENKPGEIAQSDVYGMRSLGPGVTFRVRIKEGHRIPRDLTDLEEAAPITSTDVVADRLARTEATREGNRTVTQLREELGSLGLETSGNKATLEKRLEDYRAAEEQE